MGFTTRSDIGPARPAAGVVLPMGTPNEHQFGQPPPGYVAGRGRGMGDLAKSQGEAGGASVAGPPAEVDRMDYSESNYDEFAGYSERLFSGTAYDEDDAEADQIYQNVDEAMEARRKRARERQMLQEQKKARADRPRIADQFADLKRDLSSVTPEQWDSIPEVGDHSLKYKQSRRKDSFTPVPDSILLMQGGGGGANGTARSVDPNEGLMSALTTGSGRNSVITSRLDRISDNIEGQTVVDPKGYLTSLNSIKITSDAEIGDIKKARVLLQSVTTTNPQHGPGWIAAARVEEHANKMVSARKVILEGCEKAPHSEDVWLEAARLHPQDKSKIILNNALRALPQSVKIYLQLASYETNFNQKKAILRKGLENIPNSVTLWKAAIELENVHDAKILLSRAIECLPTCLDMYLALAKLETHANARKILNMARENIPTERKVWIYAATLEEVNNNLSLVPKIVEKMVVSLEQIQTVIKREEWLAEAIECERMGAPYTGQQIVKHTIHIGVEKEDCKKIWLDDIHACLTNHQPPAVEIARGIADVALASFPNKRSVWLQAIMIEKEYGDAARLEDRLQHACQAVPHAEILWLMYAKEKWLNQDINSARSILMQAYQHNPQSEQIYLAAIKLEWENNELPRTRMLLARAKEVIGTPKVYLKFALFELEQGQTQAVVTLLEEGIAKHPTFEKFYLMLGQVYDHASTSEQDIQKSRTVFQQGIKQCPQSVPLWRSLIWLEEKDKGVVKARSIGEMARLRAPKNELLYVECLRLERRHNFSKLYQNLLAKALQDCPQGGAIYAEMLLNIPKAQYKARTMEALKKVPHSDVVLLAIARLFERSFIYRKAYKYYERALTVNPRLGDAYVYYFACAYIQIHKKALLENASHMHQANGSDARVARALEDNTSQYSSALRNTETVHEDMLAMEGVDEEDDDDAKLEATVQTTMEAAGAAENSANGAAGGNASAVEKPTEKQGKPLNSSEDSSRAPSASTTTETAVAAASATSVGDREAKLRELLKRCEDAQPNCGELWNCFTKQTHLRRKSIKEKLLLAVQSVFGFELLPGTCEF